MSDKTTRWTVRVRLMEPYANDFFLTTDGKFSDCLQLELDNTFTTRDAAAEQRSRLYGIQ